MSLRLLSIILLVHSATLAAAPNILFICIDDLRPELGCYGVDYIQSPHIDSLASEGLAFTRHYVQAPTCGASRYTMLTGTYGPGGNGALFNRAKQLKTDPESVGPSMPAWFRQNGYETVSIGKVSHHPGGRGGSNWDDKDQLEMPLSWDQSLMPSGLWEHPKGAMHGLANGEKRGKSKEMDVYQSFDGPDTAYPDGLITDAALDELERLEKSDKPFFLAVGLIRPHLPFGAPAQHMKPYRDAGLPETLSTEKPEGKTTWHSSGEFMKYNRWGKDPNADVEFALEVRRHYAACVTYVDAQVGRLMSKLDELGIDEDTIVVLWGDHGWHLGEHSIWGKHALFEESLRSPLIIRSGKGAHAGARAEAVVESIDIYPTLCQLAELPTPEALDGISLVPQLENPSTPGRGAVSYHGSRVSLRTESHRLIIHKNGFTELYDHNSPDRETRNLSQETPALVAQMAKMLYERAPNKLSDKVFEKITP
ncbi:MAG: sulfatase [Verrucomicrobiota bacterium]